MFVYIVCYIASEMISWLRLVHAHVTFTTVISEGGAAALPSSIEGCHASNMHAMHATC